MIRYILLFSIDFQGQTKRLCPSTIIFTAHDNVLVRAFHPLHFSLSLSLYLSLNSGFSTSSYTIYPIYLLLQDHSFLPSLKSFFPVRHIRNPISLQNRCEQILVYFDDEFCGGKIL